MPNLLSGRRPVVPAAELTESRYQYLSLGQAQPSLGVPTVEPSVLIGKLDGTTEWMPQTDIQSKILELQNVLFVAKNGSDLYSGKTITEPKPSIGSALNIASPGTTIIVFSGDYTELNPLEVPANVTIIGQDTNVTVTPYYKTQNVFLLNSGSTIEGITVTNHQSPSFAFCLQPDAYIVDAPYIKDCASVTGPFLNDGTLFIPNKTVQNPSIPPGPLPLIESIDVPNVAKRVNQTGAGGGIRMDGAVLSEISPLKHVLVDNFIAINQGGYGILAENQIRVFVNNSRADFCITSYEAESGAVLNLNACTSSYGLYGLYSNNFGEEPYIYGAVIAESKFSNITSIDIYDTGSGYTVEPTIIIGTEWTPSIQYAAFTQVFYGNNLYIVTQAGVADATPPTHTSGEVTLGAAKFLYTGQKAIATAVLSPSGTIADVQMVSNGTGYSEIPSITFVGDGSTPAQAVATLSGIQQFIVTTSTTKPYKSTIAQVEYTLDKRYVTNVVNITGSTSTVSLFPAVYFVLEGFAINFHFSSIINANGHSLNFIGSGVTQNALPTHSGFPIEAREIYENDYGKVYNASFNERGTYKIGNIFSLDLLTQTSTLNAQNFNLTNLGAIGPLLRDGVPVGVQMKEISNNSALIASTGAIDPFTVPTQLAVTTYLQDNYLPILGDKSLNGVIQINDLELTDNIISSILLNQDIILSPNGTGKIDISSSKIINVLPPTDLTDAANKAYVDSAVSLGSPVTSISTTTVEPVILDSFDISLFRTAKYIVQVSSINKYHVIELLMTHNNIDSFLTQYGELFTTNSLGSFQTDIVSGSLQLTFVPLNEINTIKVARQTIPT